MKQIFYLVRKEFRQIFRNKSILPAIFAMPIIQLLIMPLAADYEVKNINIAVVDHDHSTYTQRMINTITGNGYFKLVSYGESYPEAMHLIEKDKADLILEIPANFEKRLVKENEQSVYVAINAINGTKANVGAGYLGKILMAFNNDVRMQWIPQQRTMPMPTIEIASSNWFNEMLNYKFFMVPGILVVLVTMVSVYLCSLNIVKEKEVGTIEQINVTPIRKHQFILGKLIPFWLIGIFVFTIGMFVVGRLIYGIVPAGNMLVVYAFLALYLIAMLGFGLLISTFAQTQQQAMSVAFFFMMIFLLMSGLFTSIDSMPDWARMIARFNPVTYFIEVMRMVVLKGSGFRDIGRYFLIILGFAVFFNGWAVVNYRKTSG